MRTTGGVLMPTPTIRAVQIAAAGTGTTRTLAVPVGSVVGDRLVVFIGSSWDVTSCSVPSGGLTSYYTNNASGWNGTIRTKVLQAADIGGNVTTNFAGSHGNVICRVTLVGNPTYRGMAGVRSSSGGSGGYTYADGQQNDLILHFGSARLSSGTAGATCSRGIASTSLQSLTNAQGRLYQESLAAAGSITANWTMGGTNAGYFHAGIAFYTPPS